MLERELVLPRLVQLGLGRLERAAARREQERQAATAQLSSLQQAARELQSRLTETVLRPAEAAARALAKEPVVGGGAAGV